MGKKEISISRLNFMNMFISITLGLFILFNTADVFAQSNVKVAVIDLAKVLRSYNESQKLSNQLKDEIDKKQQELNKSKTEVEKFGRELSEKINSLSQKEKENRESILKTKIESLRNMELKFNQELRQMQISMQEKISDKINEATKQIAQKEGYTMVINKGMVLYNLDQSEISDKVIEILNKK